MLDQSTIPDLDVMALDQLDFCGALSCTIGYDPEFPPLICTLPVKHDGMHHQHDVPCYWDKARRD